MRSILSVMEKCSCLPCMNCARTAWTPGVGAADAGSQAHAGLRDRLCLESRATFARNEQTRLGGGTRSALSRQGLRGAGAWLSTHGVKSSSLHEGRRCRSMRECVRGFGRSTCPAPLPSSLRECVRGFRHTARVMRLAASGAHHCTRAGAAGDCSGPLPSSVCECRQG